MNRDVKLLIEKYQSIYETQTNRPAVTELGAGGTSNGIAFRKKDNIDIGCCIGVKHGATPTLSKQVIQRILNIKPSLSGAYEEGAGGDPIQPILGRLGIKVIGNWDQPLIQADKGARNPLYSSVYLFMQFDHDANPNSIKNFNGTTIRDAITKWISTNKGNIQMSALEDIKKAGFGDSLDQPFTPQRLRELFTSLQDSVYPPSKNYELEPNSYFGSKMYHIEYERNKSLYNCIANGGVAFAGAGHLTDLKQQYPDDIELIDADKTVG